MKIFFLTLLVFVVCKNIGKKGKMEFQNKTLITVEEWNQVSKKVITKINSIKNSENIEPNGGENYYDRGTKYFTEVVEDMKTHQKKIDYSYKNNSDSFRNFESFTFFIDVNKEVILILNEKYNYNKSSRTIENRVLDTLLFKSNSVIFWKNNPTPSAKELKNKEEEILNIKSAISEYIN